ncbi:MAG: fibronectin type III domain-containing protein [Clostridia bacterium]
MAVNEGGESASSNEVMAVLQEKPPVEVEIKLQLKAKAGNSEVVLDWEEADGATEYAVKRSLTRDGPYDVIASNVAGLTYIDTNLVNGTKYYYVVAAVIDGVEKAESKEVVAEPREHKKSLSMELKIEADQGQANLTWVELMPLNAEGYTVKRSETLGGPYITVADGIAERAYTDTGLDNEVKYYYIIYAVAEGEEIAVSNEEFAALKGNDNDQIPPVEEDKQDKQQDDK